MFELSPKQTLFYRAEKQGIGQVAILCGSIVIHRHIPEEEMQRATNEIFRINEGLRTYFIEKDGTVYQDFKPYEEQAFDVLHFESEDELDKWGSMYATIPLKLDIRSEGSGIPDSAWKNSGTSRTLIKNVVIHKIKTAAKQVRHGIKSRPACCEIKLFYLPDGCGAILKMHHIASDAWTMLLVANQFVRIINGETPESYHYEDFIKSEEAYKESKRYARDRAFFEEQYQRCPEPSLLWPSVLNNLTAKRQTTKLSVEETNRIREYASAHNTSPYILFLTAVSVYISRKLQRDTFYVGSVVLNRSGKRELNTVGMFINAIPLLIELDMDATFADAFAQMQMTNLSCCRHEKGNTDSSVGDMLYDMWVSYQTATLEADPTIACTQYYCNYAPTVTIFTVEDRSTEGCFKIHFDHNLQTTEAEVDELFRVTLAVLRDGIADDSKKVGELGV